jgi:hypothetical protein
VKEPAPQTNVNRFLPNLKWQRNMAARGQDHQHLMTLPLIGLRKDERIVARLLRPVFADLPPGWDCLFFSEHEWRNYPHKIKAVCPLQTHEHLLAHEKKELVKCAACAAGVPLNSHFIFHAALEGKGGFALKLNFKDAKVLEEIIQDGCLDFEKGTIIELWREGWKLRYEILEPDPIDEQEFELTMEVTQVNVWRYQVKGELLKMMAEAFTGWCKAGKPEPETKQHQALLKLLPEATLLHIPWGFKGPQRFGWRDTPPSLMSNQDYLRLLDCGNIGLRCGVVGVGEKLFALIGLDADTDKFAAELEELNPWLAITFCVRGKRGKKWFFLIEAATPRIAETCAHSTKIKCGVQDVGDWLGEGKQGVVLGLHPSGCFYENNGLPLATILPADVMLPEDCQFARTFHVPPVFKGETWMNRRDDLPTVALRTLRTALNYIPPEERDDWFTVGAALKTWGVETGRLDDARHLWDEWSSGSSKFDAGGQEKLWESLARKSESVITPGSLFFLAHKNGWRTDGDDAN